MEVFLNGAELSLNSVILANSGNLEIHWSMNWAQFKDFVSHMSLVDAVVASWSLTQEVQVRALLISLSQKTFRKNCIAVNERHLMSSRRFPLHRIIGMLWWCLWTIGSNHNVPLHSTHCTPWHGVRLHLISPWGITFFQPMKRVHTWTIMPSINILKEITTKVG